jgi:hypothetical protein
VKGAVVLFLLAQGAALCELELQGPRIASLALDPRIAIAAQTVFCLEQMIPGMNPRTGHSLSTIEKPAKRA